MKILIAGGAGFIGSTIASAAIDAGHQPIILDNLVTGRPEFCAGRIFYPGDIADGDLVDRIFAEHPDIVAAIHCAALIVVPESVAQPIRYYRENVSKTVDFVARLVTNGVRRLVFSSSASIYEPGPDFSVDEDSAIRPLSPYARTKAVVEQILADIAASGPLRVLSLRYFNPIGADPKLRTGLQVPTPSHALGKLIEAYRTGVPFRITGVDYPTRDGSGIRDYVHVWDLARAHLCALERFDTLFDGEGGDGDGGGTGGGHQVINLGSGAGTTVRELVDAFNLVVDRPVRVEPAPRRPGDTAGAFTRSPRAERLLGWRADEDVTTGIVDTLRWFMVRDQILADPSRSSSSLHCGVVT